MRTGEGIESVSATPQWKDICTMKNKTEKKYIKYQILILKIKIIWK
jgi:hypothetical protein